MSRRVGIRPPSGDDQEDRMEQRGFDHHGLARMDEVLSGHAADGSVPGLAWLVARHGEVHAGWAGTSARDGGRPIARDSIFRISSMTKPITAVAALTLVEECRLRLDEPVDPWLPELADRRVLADPRGSIDDTVPAARPITLRDLLTFRFGHGMDFGAFGEHQPVEAALEARGIGTGPPRPQEVAAPDEWMAGFSDLPLSHQPGERWLYNTGADVLGVLIARAAGKPFEQVLRERVFEPLGMRDTGFSVPAADLGRFGACHTLDETGVPAVFDPVDGQWASAPAFPSGAGGLVSTIDDYAAFAGMLLRGGTAVGHRILSPASIALMTTDHLTAEQRSAGPSPSGDEGWGFGVGVQVAGAGYGRPAGSYGWAGGLGSRWVNDPASGLATIVLTNQMFTSPTAPAVCEDLLTCAATALA